MHLSQEEQIHYWYHNAGLESRKNLLADLVDTLLRVYTNDRSGLLQQLADVEAAAEAKAGAVAPEPATGDSLHHCLSNFAKTVDVPTDQLCAELRQALREKEQRYLPTPYGIFIDTQTGEYLTENQVYLERLLLLKAHYRTTHTV